MTRTESKIVTVAPNKENSKIREMEMFGWSKDILRRSQDGSRIGVIKGFLFPQPLILA